MGVGRCTDTDMSSACPGRVLRTIVIMVQEVLPPVLIREHYVTLGWLFCSSLVLKISPNHSWWIQRHVTLGNSFNLFLFLSPIRHGGCGKHSTICHLQWVLSHSAPLPLPLNSEGNSLYLCNKLEGNMRLWLHEITFLWRRESPSSF